MHSPQRRVCNQGGRTRRTRGMSFSSDSRDLSDRGRDRHHQHVGEGQAAKLSQSHHPAEGRRRDDPLVSAEPRNAQFQRASSSLPRLRSVQRHESTGRVCGQQGEAAPARDDSCVRQHQQHGHDTEPQVDRHLTQRCSNGMNRGGDTEDSHAVEQLAAQHGAEPHIGSARRAPQANAPTRATR